MTPVEASTGSASTTRTFRFGLVPFAALAFSIGLVLENISLAWAQSDDASGDAACALYGPSRAKGDCRVEGESGCSHIFGLFKELHFTLRALMEIRAMWAREAVQGLEPGSPAEA